MWRKIQKIILSVLVGVLLLANFATTAKAATWYNQGFNEWYPKVFDRGNESEIFGERYVYFNVLSIFYSLGSLALNSLSGTPGIIACVLSNNINPECAANAVLSDSQGGQQFAAGGMGSMITALMSNPPASGVHYAKTQAAKFHLIPEANAQTGFGFQGLNPVLGLWRAMRNIVYVLMILITVVLAFMIMFRVKISPQVAISVQSAIPTLIITILLVTFSYAIAGFMVDLVYVVIGLIGTAFTSSGVLVPAEDQWNNVFNLLTLGPNVGGIGNGAIGLIGIYFVLFPITAGWALLTNTGLAGPVAALVGLPILFIVAILVLFFVAFRILWLLLLTYVRILFLIILAPVLISLGALRPQAGFGPWLTNLVSNLAVYPTVSFMFFLSFVFLAAAMPGPILDFINWIPLPIKDFVNPFAVSSATFDNTRLWIPPLMNLGAIELGARILWLGASFVIITLIPSAANMIRAFIQGQAFDFGTAIGQALAPAAAPWNATEGYRRWSLGRQVYNQTGPVGRAANAIGTRFGLTSDNLKSIAQTILGYKE